jgi:hypothetical protein
MRNKSHTGLQSQPRADHNLGRLDESGAASGFYAGSLQAGRVQHDAHLARA